MAFWYILWPFSVFYGHLNWCFFVICCTLQVLITYVWAFIFSRLKKLPSETQAVVF
jgi:hypothetical protein